MYSINIFFLSCNIYTGHLLLWPLHFRKCFLKTHKWHFHEMECLFRKREKGWVYFCHTQENSLKVSLLMLWASGFCHFLIHVWSVSWTTRLALKKCCFSFCYSLQKVAECFISCFFSKYELRSYACKVGQIKPLTLTLEAGHRLLSLKDFGTTGIPHVFTKSQSHGEQVPTRRFSNVVESC